MPPSACTVRERSSLTGFTLKILLCCWCMYYVMILWIIKKGNGYNYEYSN